MKDIIFYFIFVIDLLINPKHNYRKLRYVPIYDKAIAFQGIRVNGRIKSAL